MIILQIVGITRTKADVGLKVVEMVKEVKVSKAGTVVATITRATVVIKATIKAAMLDAATIMMNVVSLELQTNLSNNIMSLTRPMKHQALQATLSVGSKSRTIGDVTALVLQAVSITD